MTTLKNFLIKNKACSNGFEYAKDMTLTEFYNNCNRGNWIIWLFSKTNANDTKALVLAAAHCANACRHFLEDKRSLKAIDAALNFESYSKIRLDGICRAAACAARAAARAARAARAGAAARYASAAAARYAADAAAYAAYAARAARAAYPDADADAAYYAYATYADAACADAACAADARALRVNNKLADIVRKHLPLEIWNQEIINN